jgi:hypothetical protein
MQFLESLSGVYILGEVDFFSEATDSEVDKANLFVINLR